MTTLTTTNQIRLGRNFVRAGDPIKVRLPGKTQFRTGFKFIEAQDDNGETLARVRTPNGGWRFVGLDGIKRVAVTKDGEARQ